MSNSTRNRGALSVATLLASLALLAGACGNDDDDSDKLPNEPTAAVSDAGGSVPSSGSVAPNTFLTFDGRQYRLVELLQADFVDESSFEEVGEASDADIDQEDLTVYRKSGDSEAVFTYAEGTESEAVGEEIPALWYRWAIEP